MRSIGVAILLLALGVSVRAQDKAYSPLPDHLPLRTEACFGRVYDAEHLLQHPRQRVTQIHLFRDFALDQTAEEPPLSSGTFKDSDGEDGRIGLTAYVGFRDRPGVYWNWLSCVRSEGTLRCGIDCDGGGFKLLAAGEALLLENEGFVVTGGCGASDEDNANRDFVRPGADDRAFRLDRAPIAACAARRDALKPEWAKLGAPLRERLDRDEAVCFERRYDAAHLKKHPRQTVRRISVGKPAGKRALHAQARDYELMFRVELKNGRKFDKTTTCSPERYAYVCTHDPAMDMSQDFYLTRAGDKQIMLRDRRGKLADLFGASLAADDRMFRLDAAAAANCGL